MGKSGGDRISKKFSVSLPGIFALDCLLLLLLLKSTKSLFNRCSDFVENDFSRI